jgi:hypothetical protein
VRQHRAVERVAANVHLCARRRRMTIQRIVAVLLIVLGVIALAWGGISYTREEEVLDLGPLEAEAETRETIPLPPILGIVAIGAGVVLLLFGRRTGA